MDRESLEWAIATDPLFTVIVDGQTIPYHEFGPESEGELITESGLIVRPDTHWVDVETQDGNLSRFDLSHMLEKQSRTFFRDAADSSHGDTEG